MEIKNIIKILLIVVWMGVIFTFSSQNGKTSLGLSKNIIIKVAEFIKQEKLDPAEIEQITKKYIVIIRKGAHFFSYFVLAIFVYIFLKDYLQVKERLVFTTIFLCFLYAVTDEIHQLFSIGRTARVFDVFVDTLGAALSTVLLTLVSYIKNKCITKK